MKASRLGIPRPIIFQVPFLRRMAERPHWLPPVNVTGGGGNWGSDGVAIATGDVTRARNRFLFGFQLLPTRGIPGVDFWARVRGFLAAARPRHHPAGRQPPAGATTEIPGGDNSGEKITAFPRADYRQRANKTTLPLAHSDFSHGLIVVTRRRRLQRARNGRSETPDAAPAASSEGRLCWVGAGHKAIIPSSR